MNSMFVDEKTLRILEQEKLVLNFAHQDITDSVILDTFGHLDNIVRFDDNWKMAHILHAAGIFTSVSDARKSGWNQEIASGWQKCWDPKHIRLGFDWLAGAAILGKKQKRKAIWVLR